MLKPPPMGKRDPSCCLENAGRAVDLDLGGVHGSDDMLSTRPILLGKGRSCDFSVEISPKTYPVWAIWLCVDRTGVDVIARAADGKSIVLNGALSTVEDTDSLADRCCGPTLRFPGLYGARSNGVGCWVPRSK